MSEVQPGRGRTHLQTAVVVQQHSLSGPVCHGYHNGGKQEWWNLATPAKAYLKIGCKSTQPIKSGHYSLQSFVISQMPCHGVIMRRLENRFSAAFWHQHLVVFLLCATHSIMLILSQYKVCVGQHCVRAHHVTISSYHLVKGWVYSKVPSQGCSSEKSSVEWITEAGGASWGGPAISFSPESESPLSAVQTLHTTKGCEHMPTHCPNRLLNPGQSVLKLRAPPGLCQTAAPTPPQVSGMLLLYPERHFPLHGGVDAGQRNQPNTFVWRSDWSCSYSNTAACSQYMATCSYSSSVFQILHDMIFSFLIWTTFVY